MTQILAGLALFIGLLRPLVFAIGAVVAGLAALSWAARTRRLSPFSPVARFVRDRVDPRLFAPMERRILRAGGTTASAPWWTLALVVVGGLVLLSVLEFVVTQLFMVAAASSRGGASLVAILVAWTFGFLRIAIIARVISSWWAAVRTRSGGAGRTSPPNGCSVRCARSFRPSVRSTSPRSSRTSRSGCCRD